MSPATLSLSMVAGPAREKEPAVGGVPERLCRRGPHEHVAGGPADHRPVAVRVDGRRLPPGTQTATVRMAARLRSAPDRVEQGQTALMTQRSQVQILPPATNVPPLPTKESARQRPGAEPPGLSDARCSLLCAGSSNGCGSPRSSQANRPPGWWPGSRRQLPAGQGRLLTQLPHRAQPWEARPAHAGPRPPGRVDQHGYTSRNPAQRTARRRAGPAGGPPR